LTLVSSCSAESDALADAVAQSGNALGAMTFCGIFVPGLNRRSWLPGPDARVMTFFQTPELRKAGQAVDFLPLCYADILSLLRRRRPTALLTMVSPPGPDGRCSFGTAVDFIADLWREIPIRIAHINPGMPVTPGDRGIPFDELTAIIEADQLLRGMADEAADPIAEAIGQTIAAFVPDGATLQTGLGKIPGAAVRALTGHRGLRFHTGLIGDAVIDLASSGALADGRSVTAGVAIGSPELYRAVCAPYFDFQPVSVTHSLPAIAAKGPFVAINSAIEVDLFGQVYSELTPRGFMSGPGGASDFSRAAREAGGLRIIALPSAAGDGGISRVVAPGAAAGPVALGRMDVDLIVTEFGSADLRDRGHDERAKALIEIAHPAHRDALGRAWSEQSRLH
jgi:acyl-CoA hydrolase